MSRHRVFRQRRDTVTREIAGEVLLVPVRGKLAQLQQIFVLNPVGAYIWRQLDGERDLEAIHRGLVDTFEVAGGEAEVDLFEYLGALEEAGLVSEATSSSEASPQTPKPASAAWPTET